MENYQERILSEVKDFAENEIRPFAGEYEKNEAIPKDIIEKMAKKGYLAASFPLEYNGLGLDPVYYGLFTEQLGKACCSTRSLITVHTSLVGESLLKWGSNDQKKKWLFPMASGKKISAFALSEPEIGSDASKVQTSYVESGNKFIINGKKKWISFGDIADIFLVIASNKGIITAFILERDFSGIKTKKMQGLLAGKASHIAEIIFDNVEVPKENVLGKIGAGFSFITNTALDHGRYSIAWAGVAIAQAAIEEMVMYSRTRNQFGKKLHEFQLIRGKIADSITNVNAARALCLKAGELRKNNDDEAEIYTTMAKHFSSKIAMSVAAEAVQIHGGNGCYDKFPVERLFREAKILEIIEGTTEIQQEIISAYGLRKYYRSVKNKI